jgi:hypothetical protein
VLLEQFLQRECEGNRFFTYYLSSKERISIKFGCQANFISIPIGAILCTPIVFKQGTNQT